MIWFRPGCKEQGAYIAQRKWGRFLIDFVLGKEIKAGVKRGGMGEVAENQIS